MPEKESEYPSAENGGWIFSLTLPRVLEYKNEILYQRPFKMVENLREEKIIENKNINSSEIYNLKLNSRNVEIKLDLDIKDSDFIDIRLKFKDEYISLNYDKKENVFVVDRTNMELGGKGVRKFKLEAQDSLKLWKYIIKMA